VLRAHGDHVLRLTTVTVLGPEQHAHVAARSEQHGVRVAETAVDAGRMREQSELAPTQQRERRRIFSCDAIESGEHRHAHSVQAT
jgi:hypothetical protein